MPSKEEPIILRSTKTHSGILITTSGAGLSASGATTAITSYGANGATTGYTFTLNNQYGGGNINRNFFAVGDNFYLLSAFASGTNTVNWFGIYPVINNTGGTTISRGIYYNPTLTSVTGTTHRAIETTSGDVIFNGGNVGIGTTNPTYKLEVFGGIRSAFVTTTTVHGEGNTLLLLSGLNGTNPGVNEGRLHIGYNQNDPELRLNSGGIAVSTGKWTFLPQIWFAGGITSSHNIALTIDGMSNGVTNSVASEIIRFTQRGGQFANFYDAGAGLSEFRIWQQANSSNYIYLKPGQTSYFSSGNLVIGGTTDAGYKLDVNGTSRVRASVEKLFRTEHTNGNYVELVIGNGSAIGTGNAAIYFNGSPYYSFGGSNNIWYVPVHRVASAASIFQIYGGGSPNSTLGDSIYLGSNAVTGGAFTATSGTQNTVSIGVEANAIWKPTSGNATYNLLTIVPRIETSGTYSGIVRGLYINPVLTSITGTTVRAIETTSGNVIFNGGNVGIGTSSPTGRNGYGGGTLVELVDNAAYSSFNLNGGNISSPTYFTLGAQGAGADIRVNNKPLRIAVNSVDVLTIPTTGNVLINTTTDSGYKLDVSGITRVVGTDIPGVFTVGWGKSNSITLGSNTANSPQIYLGSLALTAHPGGSSLAIDPGVLTTTGTGVNTNRPITIVPQVTGTSTGNMILLSSGARIGASRHQPTSGVLNMVAIGDAPTNQYMDFAPASGNATFNSLFIKQQINTSGTYAGIVRGIYYDPTLTSTTGVIHRAIETTSGDVLFAGNGPKLIFQETTAAINTPSTTSIFFGASTTPGYGAGIFAVGGAGYNRANIVIASGGATDSSNVTTANANFIANPGGTDIYKNTTIYASNLTFRTATLNTGTLSMYWSHAETKVGLFSSCLGSYGRGDFRIALLNTLDSTTVSTTNTRFMVTGDTYNVLIGTTTDNGYKLQVNGNASLVGSAGAVGLNVDFGNVNSNVKILSHGSSDFSQIQIGTSFSLSRNGGGDPSISTTFGLGIISNSLSLQTSTAAPGKLWIKGNYGLGSAYFGANNSNGVTASTLYFQNSETPTAVQNVLATFNLWGISDNVTVPTIPASSMFSLHSTTRGFLAPRMTTAQILAIASPAEGLQVYNTDFKTICFYNGTAWQRVTSTAM